MTDPGKVDMVARCLARLDDKFISAEQWAGVHGNLYRIRALAVLLAIENFENGKLTGGLPPLRSET